ncbi:hypothetical protein QZH41_011500, partial [Actinostola sp. cb2023]
QPYQLDAIFSRQGIPDVLKSDNGPPFNGHEFSNFAEYLGFHHRKITPVWPKANGEAERFMRSLKKCVTTAHTEHKNWKQELFKFLRQYRATPHSTTNLSPCEALNQRKLKTTLPEITLTNPLPRQHEKVIPSDIATPQQLVTPEDHEEMEDEILEEETARNPAEGQETVLRRSTRERKSPGWLTDYVVHIVYQK